MFLANVYVAYNPQAENFLWFRRTSLEFLGFLKNDKTSYRLNRFPNFLGLLFFFLITQAIAFVYQHQQFLCGLCRRVSNSETARGCCRNPGDQSTGRVNFSRGNHCCCVGVSTLTKCSWQTCTPPTNRKLGISYDFAEQAGFLEFFEKRENLV